MRGMFVCVAALALGAGTASASFMTQGPGTSGVRELSSATPLHAARGGTGTVVSVPVTGATTNGLVGSGDANNTVLVFDIAAAAGLPSGTAVTMTGLGWDVVLTAFDPSWLSEARVYFDDSVAPDLSGLFLRVGNGQNVPGVNAAFASGGLLDLSTAGIPNIALPNGQLRLEFHETFDDPEVTPDARFESGGFQVVIAEVVPAPGAAGLLGLAGLMGLRRRR